MALTFGIRRLQKEHTHIQRLKKIAYNKTAINPLYSLSPITHHRVNKVDYFEVDRGGAALAAGGTAGVGGFTLTEAAGLEAAPVVGGGILEAGLPAVADTDWGTFGPTIAAAAAVVVVGLLLDVDLIERPAVLLDVDAVS